MNVNNTLAVITSPGKTSGNNVDVPIHTYGENTSIALFIYTNTPV